MLPTFLGIAVFSYYPSLDAVWHSLYRWDGSFTEEYRGLQNFKEIFTSDPLFWHSFKIIGILVFANVIKMWPSIFAAVVVHRLRSERWQYLYRVIFVVPMIIPGIVRLLIWKSFYDPTVGILNRFLQETGLMSILQWLDVNWWHIRAFETGQPAWLGHQHLVLPAIIFWGFPWVGTFGVLIYLAGLQNISQDVYEAAELDGVNWWSKFWKIELPLIMTMVRINLILMTIGTFMDYGFFLILLGPSGGPNNAGLVPGLYMFSTAFFSQRYGYACALGMIMFVIVLTITIFYQKFVRVEK